jgi:hypothetical protein
MFENVSMFFFVHRQIKKETAVATTPTTRLNMQKKKKIVGISCCVLFADLICDSDCKFTL